MSVVRRSVLFSALDKYVQQALLIVTTAVMARLLTPAETGLFLVVNSVLLLADNLRTFGVGIYIVRVDELRPATLRSAFTVTMLLSLAIMAAVQLGAGPIARFYGEPALADLLRLGSFAFVAVPFATPIVALLQRELAFCEFARINIAVNLVNAGVTMTLGATGFGPASFVWGFLAGSLVLAVLSIATRPHLWIYRPTIRGAREVFSFGLLSSAITFANMAYELLPRLLLGKILGFDATGLYARAITLCQIPERAINSALNPVVLPVMAARARAGTQLKAGYLRGHTLMSGLQWPMLLTLAILADPVVLLLLGAQWEAAAPLVRLISLATMALAPAFMTFPLLVAVERIRDALLSSLIALPPSIAILVVAAHQGLAAAAASMLVIAPLQMAVALRFVRRAIDLTWRELVDASKASAAVAAATAVIPALVVLRSPNGFAVDWVEAAVALGGAGLGWLAAVWFTDHPLRGELVAAARMVLSVMYRPVVLPRTSPE